jgi:tetratricopeptide (TPR) repeat protein
VNESAPRIRRLLAAIAVTCLAACGSAQKDATSYLDDATAQYEAGDLVRARIQLKNALQIDPKLARARYLLALIDEREQDYPNVLANLLVAVDADPKLLDARIKLGNYYAVGLKPAETRAQADAAMALAPNDPAVRVLNARAYYVEGERAKALDETRNALKLDPSRADAVTLAASIHAEAGERAAALEVVDAAVTRLREPDREALRRVRSTLLVQFADIAAAEQELRSMAADYPKSADYDLALARLYAGQGRNAEAEERLRALVKRDPDNAEWRVQLAGLLASQNRAADAEQFLRDAIARQPDSASLRFALGGFYESAGRGEDARKTYAEIAAAAPGSADGLAARSRMVALAVTTDEAAARELVTAMLKDAPQNVDALLYRAAFSYQDGRYDETIADLRSVLARQPESERALFMLARTYVTSGEAALAEDTYRSLLALNPSLAPARNELAAIVAGRGDLTEAEKLLRAALAAAPGDETASRNLVLALLRQGNYQAAATEAERMSAQGAPTGASEYQLGLALELQNQADKAIAAFRAAVTKNPLADQPLADLTRLLVQTGRPAEAEQYLKSHIAAHPDHRIAPVLLGTVYRDTGRAELARQVLREATRAKPASPAAWVALASVADSGSDEQLAILRDAHAQLPADAQLGLALGAAYERRRDYPAALGVYEAVVASGSDNEFVVTNLAILLLDYRSDAASHARALALAERFTSGAKYPAQLAALGWAYYRNDRAAEAVRYLEQAVAASPEPNPQMAYYLGMAALAAGDKARARAELQRAIAGAEQARITFTGLDEARATLRTLG